MALQSSGKITAKDINVEFRRWGTNNPPYEGQFMLWGTGSGLINKGSKPIAMSDFYGAEFRRPAVGSGGSTTIKNGYKHHLITSNGEFCITAVAAGPSDLVDIQHMVLGGGAGGGGGGTNGPDKSECGGGGGAGAYVSGKNTIPMKVECHSIGLGIGGAGGVYNGSTTGRGQNGGSSTLIITGGSYVIAQGGGGGGAVMYGGNFGGLNGACGGGGAGKFYATYSTDGGTGVQGFDGGNGGKAGAGGGGTRAKGNNYVAVYDGGAAGGSTTHPTYGQEWGCGGGGAGQRGGTGHGKGGNGGNQPGSGTATSATQYGSGGGGGGSRNSGTANETGGAGMKGCVIISIKQ